MISYGMGPSALADRLNVTYDYAENMIRNYYSTFAGVKKWKDNETFYLKRYGYSTTLYGRRRSPIFMVDCPQVTAPSGTPEAEQQHMKLLLWKAEYDAECATSKFDPQNVEEREKVSRSIRQAINFEIQGSVAELINEGMVALVRAGYELKAQVHDEVIVEIEDTEEARKDLAAFLSKTFEKEINGVRFVLDTKFGCSWACGKE